MFDSAQDLMRSPVGASGAALHEPRGFRPGGKVSMVLVKEDPGRRHHEAVVIIASEPEDSLLQSFDRRAFAPAAQEQAESFQKAGDELLVAPATIGLSQMPAEERDSPIDTP